MSNEIINVELLISSIESRPCLWDKSNEDYKDRHKTTAGWKEVCSLLKSNFGCLSEKERYEFRKYNQYIKCYLKLSFYV